MSRQKENTAVCYCPFMIVRNQYTNAKSGQIQY